MKSHQKKCHWVNKMTTVRFTLKLFVFAILCGLVVGQGRSTSSDSSSDFVFPGPASRDKPAGPVRVTEEKLGCCEKPMSTLSLAQRINSVDSVEEFLKLVEDVPQVEVASILHSRFAETGERSNAEVARPAKCIPELQPVPIKQSGDPSTIYFPSCTRVKRCGGCCSHSLLSCQPIATEIRNFEVVVAKIDMNKQMKYAGKEIVPLEEHTKCKCDCRIKAEHCAEKQIYVEDECRCECANADEEEKCRRNNDTKLWNPENCTCGCREELNCSTGYYYDLNTCRCRELPISRNWFGSSIKTGYRFGQTQKPENVPPVIVPLDASDPRRKPKEDPEY